MKRKQGGVLLFLLLAVLMLAGCAAQTEKAADGKINTLTFSAAALTQEPTHGPRMS